MSSVDTVLPRLRIETSYCKAKKILIGRTNGGYVLFKVVRYKAALHRGKRYVVRVGKNP